MDLKSPDRKIVPVQVRPRAPVLKVLFTPPRVALQKSQLAHL